jgi:hypothetical protein
MDTFAHFRRSKIVFMPQDRNRSAERKTERAKRKTEERKTKDERAFVENFLASQSSQNNKFFPFFPSTKLYTFSVWVLGFTIQVHFCQRATCRKRNVLILLNSEKKEKGKKERKNKARKKETQSQKFIFCVLLSVGLLYDIN